MVYATSTPKAIDGAWAGAWSLPVYEISLYGVGALSLTALVTAIVSCRLPRQGTWWHQVHLVDLEEYELTAPASRLSSVNLREMLRYHEFVLQRGGRVGRYIYARTEHDLLEPLLGRLRVAAWPISPGGSGFNQVLYSCRWLPGIEQIAAQSRATHAFIAQWRLVNPDAPADYEGYLANWLAVVQAMPAHWQRLSPAGAADHPYPIPQLLVPPSSEADQLELFEAYAINYEPWHCTILARYGWQWPHRNAVA